MPLYFYEKNGNKVGPVPVDEMLQLKLCESTLVWKEGLSGWVAAKELPELSNSLLKEPPPLPHEQKQKENQILFDEIKSSITNSILSRKLWFWYLVVTIILAVILAIGDIIGDGNDRLDILFPVYKTNWEYEHPFLAILKSSFFLFVYSSIVTVVIGFIQGLLVINRPKEANGVQSTKSPSIWEPIIVILLFLLIVAIVVWVNIVTK